jgi:hypothetical protein
MERRKIDADVPDSNLARALNRGGSVKRHAVHRAHRQMRSRLRSPQGGATYQRRKVIVEPLNSVLKEQRGTRRFRLRGWRNVAGELPSRQRRSI